MIARHGRVLLLVALLAVVLPALADPAGAVSTTRRRAGADRYATAAEVSRAVFPPGVDVVYVATGESFADALAGTPAAGQHDAPLLLTTRSILPDVTAEELDRLEPGRIVVLGGPAAVSDGVLDRLAGHTTGSVTRLSGEDRIRTAAAISGSVWTSGADTVYVANGLGFADALAGGAAAAAESAPVLLVTPDALPTATKNEIVRLAPSRIRVLGGPAAIGPAVESALRSLGRVDRLAGDSRFATSAAVAATVFDRPLQSAVLATGEDFADALAAGSAAAWMDAPVLLSVTSCVPVEVALALRNLEVDEVIVVGGESVLSPAVADLVPCEPLPPPPHFRVLSLHPSDVEPVDRADAIRAELAAMDRWFVGQSVDRRVRFQRTAGLIDVEALELPVSSADLTFAAVAEFVIDRGYLAADRHVLAYVEGEEAGACGRGGFGIAVYWNDSCGPPSATNAPDDFSVVAAISIHEIIHALGAVADCAPNAGTDEEGRSHVVGDTTDVMSPVLTTLGELRLDPGNDDYYGHGRDDCLDVADSLFLEPA